MDPSTPSDEGNYGLVHCSGPLITQGPVDDKLLQVQFAQAVRIKREVEVFQTVETEQGSGEHKEYVHTSEWKTTIVNSRNFHRAPDVHNPESWPVETQDMPNLTTRLGAYQLAVS